MSENEVGTIADTTSVAPAAPEAEPATQASETFTEKKLEPTLQEKIQAQADKVAAERASKGSKNTKKAAEKAQIPSLADPATPTSKAGDITSKEGNTTPEQGNTDPVVPPSFTPNFKLSIQKQEFEVPEMLRPLMKDAESEKQIRELCEKAFGLEFAKPRHEATRQQNEVLTGENTTMKAQINYARQLYARGDFDGFFSHLGIPQEKVLQWMADKIQYNNLPPDQKAILDARKTAEQRAYQAEDYAGSLQKQHEQLLTQQVQMALESTLARAEVKAVSDAFDARVGKPGAFKEEVNRRGDYAWRTRNELVPPEQLVQELMALVGPPAPAAPAVTAEPAAPTPAAAKATPVIPNISGRSTSALPARVKSIEDIKRRAAELS